MVEVKVICDKFGIPKIVVEIELRISHSPVLPSLISGVALRPFGLGHRITR